MNNAINERLLSLEAKIDTLLALITPKRARSSGGAGNDSRDDLTKERVGELERLFWGLVNSPDDKRLNAYRFPHALLAGLDKPTIEGVVVSVLVNQASLRRVFKRRGLGDPLNETPAQTARRVLEKTNLVLLPLNHVKLESTSKTLIAFSPGEAQRLAHASVTLPESPGWTCRERAEPKLSPFGGFFDVPEDPCGPREWPGDAGIPTTGKRFESVAKLREAIEGEDGDDLNTTEPTPSATDRLDFGTVEEVPYKPLPSTGYRQRVQFVEEE